MTAIKANGVTLKHGDGASPEVFTAIGELTGFSGLDGEASEIETTNLAATSKTFLLGIKDEGNISADMNLDPDNVQQTALRTDRDNGSLRNFQIALTDATPTTISFAAYVKSFAITGAVDGVVTASVNLRISGSATWA